MAPPAAEVLGLEVAGLRLQLDARESGLSLAAPACHAGFRPTGMPGAGLRLRVRPGRAGDPPASAQGWRPLYRDPHNWQLYQDAGLRYLFVSSPHSPPPRHVTIGAGFTDGEVVGDFRGGVTEGESVVPLQDLEIVLYANWLAQTGDFVVHASGVDDGCDGYAFVGPSGAGKSTLVSALAGSSSVSVLGEDQCIVRLMDGQFMLFGTPWHTDPAMCLPGGVPLRKVFFLDRELGHAVRALRPGAGIERLLQDSFIPYYNRPGVSCILDTLSLLAEQIPFYTLGFRLGSDVLSLIREA